MKVCEGITLHQPCSARLYTVKFTTLPTKYVVTRTSSSSSSSISQCSSRKYVFGNRFRPRSNRGRLTILSSGNDVEQKGTNGYTEQDQIDVQSLVAATNPTPFQKIMCANRGEIAIRVFRAGQELGLRTVAIYSPVDRLQPHRYKADESYLVGKADMQPVQCYLDVENVIAIAKENGVDAIHPGYGFLSENATFSRRCKEEGIVFIGPSAETIESMGDKTAARQIAIKAGVSVVPGTNEPLQSVEEAKEFARVAGYPVILKAAMGGGGRGMRVVKMEEELGDAFMRASNEAKSAFGDGRMFIEKYVEDPRHVEVQILADGSGNVIHLYERDCSVQRRHQKVIEIAPAYGLSDTVRQALYKDAVTIAKAVNYCNAGTVEFMVDKYDNHYFLEVNPRVQVEHTITEEVTGVDIVQCQIMIAGGVQLAELGMANQEAINPPAGYAIQCRVTAEDPEQDFRPETGRLESYRVPGGFGIRLDGAATTGNYISRYYDSLLCKVISHAPTFQLAVQKMQRAIIEFQVRGIKTNLPFLTNVLQQQEFLSGKATTSFIQRNQQSLFDFGETPGQIQGSRMLSYLADMVVNGPNHPGAVGPPPSPHVPPAPIIPDNEELLVNQQGWRKVILEQGPEGWAKAVRNHKGVLLTDTTWRDAHQSLLATRMRTHDMLKAAPATSKLLGGLASLEMWGGATFDVALRFLHECPWQRLEVLREAVPNIPFQMLLRGANAVGYTSYPDNVVRAFVREAVKAGIDIFRVFDSLNYVDNLKFGMDAVQEAGGIVEGTICYTGDLSDPKKNSQYNLDYYMKLAEELVDHGTHILAIKDMAGLMKPRAARTLVGALRERFPDMPLHIHTHDSAGTGVATQLACARAGADIVDVALDSMSGMTSQPSMGAVVSSLSGEDGLDTGIHPDAVAYLSNFWERTRPLYAPFESNLKSGSSEVYYHEMPGGQYTNLKFQAYSLGLETEWERIKRAYATANRALGNIVKVTPSSKVVGDLAQFMVQNNLETEQLLLEQADQVSFPQSVVEFLQGYIGQPPFGFPEPLRSKIIKDKKVIEGRPGASMKPLNLFELEARLKERYPGTKISQRDVLSAALYPKVFEGYRDFCMRHGQLLSLLPTRAFLAPLEEDEELEVDLEKGYTVVLKYKAKGELQPNGKREVYFEVNGLPRVVEVEDRKAVATTGVKRVVREKANADDLGSVGAPMAGDIVEVSVKPGQLVSAGQQICVMSAMKMETAIGAPCDGIVKHVAAIKGDTLDAMDLIVQIETSSGPSGTRKILLSESDRREKVAS